MINIIKKIPFLNCSKEIYTGLIFNNKNYFSLNSKYNTIKVYNQSVKNIFNIKTYDIYKAGTKTKEKNKLYLIKNNDNSNLYITNMNFQELEKIELKIPSNYSDDINSISFDYINNRILLSTKTMVYSVTLDGYFVKEELSKETIRKISNENSKTNIYKNLNGHYSANFKTFYQTNITSIGMFCGKKVISYIKGNSVYISLISNNGNIIETHYIEDNIIINSIINICGNMVFLVTKDDNYNYLYITAKKSKHIKIKNKYRNNGYNQIIKSLALIELSIANILNIESEKIEKLIKQSKNKDELIEINNSVSKIIYNIAELEQVLYEKTKFIFMKDD